MMEMQQKKTSPKIPVIYVSIIRIIQLIQNNKILI